MIDVNKIIAYENGEMTQEEELQLFAELIKTGECWSLQGHYGRTASQYIDAGYIDRQGNITKHFEEDEG